MLAIFLMFSGSFPLLRIYPSVQTGFFRKQPGTGIPPEPVTGKLVSFLPILQYFYSFFRYVPFRHTGDTPEEISGTNDWGHSSRPAPAATGVSDRFDGGYNAMTTYRCTYHDVKQENRQETEIIESPEIHEALQTFIRRRRNEEWTLPEIFAKCRLKIAAEDTNQTYNLNKYGELEMEYSHRVPFTEPF